MRRTKPAPVGPKRPGISKKPPRTPKLNPDMMEKAFRAHEAPKPGSAWVIRFVPLKPTLRDRWHAFWRSIGARLMNSGR